MISSESHDNADSDGEDADGFAAKLTSGPGNVFRYDVSHNNIDDGWDLYAKTDTGPIGVVTIENSLSYTNGTLSNGTVNANGDRNGYKLGGSDIAVNHIARRNIAYNNGHHGFTYNSNPGSMTIDSNLSIDNAERNFSFDEGTSTFTGNTSCRFNVDGSNDKTVGTVGSNNQFWTGTNGSRCTNYSGALGLVLRLRRQARRHPRRQGRHPVTHPSGRAGTTRSYRPGPSRRAPWACRIGKQVLDETVQYAVRYLDGAAGAAGRRHRDAGRDARRARRPAAGASAGSARGDRRAGGRRRSRGDAHPPAGVSSASWWAVPRPRRWPPTGSPRCGTRTPVSTCSARPRRWPRRWPAAGWPSCSACPPGCPPAS